MKRYETALFQKGRNEKERLRSLQRSLRKKGFKKVMKKMEESRRRCPEDRLDTLEQDLAWVSNLYSVLHILL